MMLDHLAECASDRLGDVDVSHADMLAEAEAFGDRVAERFRCRELFVWESAPVMGAHTGPGVLGLAFFAE